MKNFPVNKIQVQDGLTGKFYEPLREMLTNTLLKFFQNTTVVGKPANSSYEYSINLISKLKETQKRKIIDQYLCMQEWWLHGTGVAHTQEQPIGETPSPRWGAVAYTTSKVKINVWEVLPHVQSQKRWLWGDTLRIRTGEVARKRYPTSKVRETQVRW